MMTLSRPIRCHLVVVLSCLLAFSTLLTLPAQARSTELAVSVDSRPAGYDGRTLYRGLFLGSGPVADLIPEIQSQLKLEYFLTDDKMRSELLAYYDRVLDALEQLHPGYLDHFAQVMQSGDHVAIDQELEIAANKTLEAVEQMPEYQSALRTIESDRSLLYDAIGEFNAQVAPENQISTQDVDAVIDQLVSNQNQSQSLALVWICATFVVAVVWVVAAVDVAVVANVAGAISIYLAIGVEKYVAGPSKKAVETGQVLRDQIVHSVATNLETPKVADAEPVPVS